MSKKQKNIGVKALCSVLIVLLLATIGIAIPSKGFTDWSKFKHNKPQVEQPDKPGEEQKPGGGDNIDVEQIETNGVLLSMATATADDGTVSKILTATVTPENAENKTVDWSIYWADDAPLKDKDISEYLTLTPTADGALTATVTCKKSFRGSVAYIKVTTRVGGYEALCSVTFTGIPSSLNVDTAALKTTSDGQKYLIANTSSGFAVNLANVFGDIDESYYDKITVTVEGVGSFVAQNFSRSRVGDKWEGATKTITVDSIKDNFVTVNYQAKNITIQTKNVVENYYSSVTGNTAGTIYLDHFKSWENNEVGYFKITVSCAELNLQQVFSFRITSSINGVGLSQSTITF